MTKEAEIPKTGVTEMSRDKWKETTTNSANETAVRSLYRDDPYAAISSP